MPFDMLIALTILMLAMFWTPGPNNALLATSGLHFGFRRSVPHLLGVSLGFTLMLFLVALGLGGLFQLFPILLEILRWSGAALLLWLAWKVATSDAAKPGEAGPKPWTFAQATAFQWVNPKGWVICIGVIPQFVRAESFWQDSLIVSAMSVLTGTSSAIGWVAFGVVMQRLLTSPARRKAFSYTMAALIAGSVGLLFLE
jgi:threonine/homoserine/homoserine lactone efflux protein